MRLDTAPPPYRGWRGVEAGASGVPANLLWRNNHRPRHRSPHVGGRGCTAVSKGGEGARPGGRRPGGRRGRRAQEPLKRSHRRH
jgi:hypothetical protein